MSEVKVDTISERTADAGVTIEGVKVEDGVATFQTASGSPLVFEGATADDFETTFAITDPTADRTITFPDADVTLGASGVNTPYFYAYLVTDDTSPGDNAWTKVPCNTVSFQTGSTYDETTNYRWTPAVAGKYYLYGQVKCKSDTSYKLGEVWMAFYKNGSETITISEHKNENTSRDRVPVMSAIVDMNDTDYVELWARMDYYSGVGRFIGSGQETHFMGYKLLD